MLTVIFEKLGRLGESHEALTRRVEELEVKTNVFKIESLLKYYIRPRKKIPVFLLTCSKILGLIGRKKILFKQIFLASFYRGSILTLIVLVQKSQ
jgi:hypothetical protein